MSISTCWKVGQQRERPRKGTPSDRGKLLGRWRGLDIGCCCLGMGGGAEISVTVQAGEVSDARKAKGWDREPVVVVLGGSLV